MAQQAGMWAEFRLTTWGAVLTLVSVFLPFKMIAPGAMMIGGQPPSAKDMVKISVAGVITNMIFAATFLGLAFGLPISEYSGMLFFSAYINSFMALFNLIPFGVLDGYKMFLLNKTVWALAFIPKHRPHSDLWMDNVLCLKGCRCNGGNVHSNAFFVKVTSLANEKLKLRKSLDEFDCYVHFFRYTDTHDSSHDTLF